MNITEYVSTPEAAEILGYDTHYVANLCKAGAFMGAIKKANRWLIPRTSAEAYQPGPQGFAAHPEANPRKRK